MGKTEKWAKNIKKCVFFSVFLSFSYINFFKRKRKKIKKHVYNQSFKRRSRQLVGVTKKAIISIL